MYFVGQQDLGLYDYINYLSIPFPNSEQLWKIEIYHRSGGLKKSWYLKQDNNPIGSIEFENNMNGCGAGKINFNYLDFPIDPGDYCIVWYNNQTVYRGIFDTACDPKGGEVYLVGPKSLLDKALWYSVPYTGKTISYILQDIITYLTSQTGILWNPSFVDLGDTGTYTITYKYDVVSKKIDEWIDNLSGGRYWGIDENNTFFVRKPDTTVFSYLYHINQKAYSEIEVKKDFSQVKYTRLRLYRKPYAGGAESEYVDAVGYSTPIALEQIVGIKEDQYTFNKYLDTATCDLIGNAMIADQAIQTSIDVKGIDISKFFPKVGKLVYVEDRDEKLLQTIVSCDTITGWTGAALDASDYTEGTRSVYMTAAAAGTSMYYTFSDDQRYWKNTNLSFMMKSQYAGNFITIKVESADGVYCQEVLSIPHAGNWYWYNIGYSGFIKKITFTFSDTPPGSCKIAIDRIQVYAYTKLNYTNNIVQSNFILTPSGEDVSMKLNSYNTKANDYLFTLQNKFQIEQTKNKAA